MLIAVAGLSPAGAPLALRELFGLDEGYED